MVINTPNLYNRWQLAAALSGAPKQVIVGGRGSGKTFNLGGRGKVLAEEMPRGLFFICADTFDRIRNSTAPAMLMAWEYLGWDEYDPTTRRGHYVFNKQPPAHWPKPYYNRVSNENIIYTHTGAAFKFVSQAAKNARGFSFDGGLIDEGLTLTRGFVENDLFPALRGNTKRFNTPLHYATTIVSSMPWDASGEWLLEYARYYEDDNKGYADLHTRLPHLLGAYLDAQTDAERNRLWNYEIIPVLAKLIYYVSKDGVYYAQATVFDNLEQFSWKTLKGLWRSMDRISFMIEFLNMRYEAIGDQFYYALSEGKHCYDADDIDEYNSMAGLTSAKGLWLPNSVQSTSKYDRDVDPNRPLNMSGDWQASITPLVISQKFKGANINELRIQKDFFVKSPKWVPDVIADFARYYEPHKEKVVRFQHDHTAKGKHNTDKSIFDIVKEELKKHGWRTVEAYIGKQPEHKDRFKSINGILNESEPGKTVIRFNRKNTQTLRYALRCTTVKRSGKDGFTKDKSKETSKNYPQERTTHFTDAFDTAVLEALNSADGLNTGYVAPIVNGR